MSLEDSPGRCLESLQTLQEYAKKRKRFYRTTSTRSVLQNFERSIDGSLLLLRNWITEFNNGKPTNNDETIVPVGQVLATLQQYINAARNALRARLQHRWNYLFGPIRKERLLFVLVPATPGANVSLRERLEVRLDRELQNMSDTIGELNKQLKLLVASSKESGRQIKKQDVLEGRTQAYTVFSEFFNNHNIQEKQPFRSSALNLLWRHIPYIEDLEGKVGNTEDPGDGIIYGKEEVAKTTSVLETLHRAWLDAEDSAPCPAPEKLREMAKICLVLAGMKQPELLEDFIDSNIVDKDLGTLQKERVQTILKNHHALCAATFVAEQYRAVPREWKQGSHVELEDEEPLPLIYEHTYQEGSSGLVIRVRDPFSQKTYALKKQIIANEENRTAAARNHLEQEIKRLKELSHIHVVQLVNSYERGGAYGIILTPAATCDLEGLLGRYHKNKYNTYTNCSDREWMRPILLTAFGCLAKGLAYIHGCEIRHKDVKPGNILYERGNPNVNSGPRFLWADFGLAYDFSATKDSRTQNSELNSPRYAAPEVVNTNDMANNRRPHLDKWASVISNLDRIREHSEDKSMDTNQDSEIADDMLNHGRKTDIFSLGCVFLELLAGLVDEKLPLDVPSSRHPNEVPIFARYIPELTTWARQQEQKSDSGCELAPLFNIVTNMILREPKSRPAVGEVVQRIAAVGRQNFCKACWEELPPEDKLKPSPVPRQLSWAPTWSVNRRSTERVFKRVNSVGNHLKRIFSG